MPAKVRHHYRGPYARMAALVRAQANSNPETRCGRCGQRLTDPPHPPGDTWDAGHVVDGDTGYGLRPEAASCNRSAGASYGNRKREPRSRNWYDA
jgi:hypothetical protein